MTSCFAEVCSSSSCLVATKAAGPLNRLQVKEPSNLDALSGVVVTQLVEAELEPQEREFDASNAVVWAQMEALVVAGLVLERFEFVVSNAARAWMEARAVRTAAVNSLACGVECVRA